MREVWKKGGGRRRGKEGGRGGRRKDKGSEAVRGEIEREEAGEGREVGDGSKLVGMEVD